MVAQLSVLNNNNPMIGSRSFAPSTCDPGVKCGNGLEKIYPTCAVRYGVMNYIGEFRYAPDMLFGCGNKVVIETPRGMELGQQVSLTCTGCDKSVSRRQLTDYVKNSGQEFFRLKSGRILRTATPQDLEEQRHLDLDAKQKITFVRKLVAQRNLPIKIVECEHLLGGERIIFYFLSEDRIDFRDLVHDLNKEYHTRIEMQQVGARDEARLVADYEVCGRECCCKTFLKKLRPVSMRMAKLQKATLDPSKVSGRCGRLRCCLRYEHEGYEELDKKLPKNGQRVRTERGVGTVVDRQILTQLLMIEYDDNQAVEAVPVEEILERDLPRRVFAPEEQGSGADSPQRDRQPRGERPRSDDRQDSARRDDRTKNDFRRDPPRQDDARRNGVRRDDPAPPSPASDARPSVNPPNPDQNESGWLADPAFNEILPESPGSLDNPGARHPADPSSRQGPESDRSDRRRRRRRRGRGRPGGDAGPANPGPPPQDPT